VFRVAGSGVWGCGGGFSRDVLVANLGLGTRNLKLPLIGDVAQLGERLPCTEKVTGSSPVVSTRHRRRFRVWGLEFWGRGCGVVASDPKRETRNPKPAFRGPCTLTTA
jgi:hypothetical protein